MPRPLHALALGLLGPPPRATPPDHLQARITLGLLAADHGYALLETIETTGAPTDLASALDLIEQLAHTLDIDALAVDGHLDHEAVEDLAARARLVVLQPDPGPNPTQQP